MKMFLTRIGFGSTGGYSLWHYTRSIYTRTTSGLAQAMHVLKRCQRHQAWLCLALPMSFDILSYNACRAYDRFDIEKSREKKCAPSSPLLRKQKHSSSERLQWKIMAHLELDLQMPQKQHAFAQRSRISYWVGKKPTDVRRRIWSFTIRIVEKRRVMRKSWVQRPGQTNECLLFPLRQLQI